jgi:hypothetical protein
MCIGDRFSIMEQTLALAMVAQKFRVQVVDDHPIRPAPCLRSAPAAASAPRWLSGEFALAAL